jgi:DNA-binding helix-hairpin-helix protein with protein kinase domain
MSGAPRVQRADLTADGPLTELGKGGEGTVFDIADRSDIVFKEYLPRSGHEPNLQVLEQLVATPAGFSGAEQTIVESRTAWPTALVMDGIRLVGYLMPRIPAVFWRTHGTLHDPRVVACDLNYLTHRSQWEGNTSIVSDVPRLDIPRILHLMGNLSETMAVLHRHEIVMGDISGRNLLWTDSPQASVFVIDCDAFRKEGGAAVNHPKESPDWGDPTIQNAQTTRASDIYKLGLLSYRALWSAGARRPPADPVDADGVPNAVVDLIWRSLAPDDRPSADEWARTIRQVLLFSGRPVVQVRRAPTTDDGGAGEGAAPSPPSSPRQAPRDDGGSGSRPVIPIG